MAPAPGPTHTDAATRRLDSRRTTHQDRQTDFLLEELITLMDAVLAVRKILDHPETLEFFDTRVGIRSKSRHEITLCSWNAACLPACSLSRGSSRSGMSAVCTLGRTRTSEATGG